jgi:hypothetical protein
MDELRSPKNINSILAVAARCIVISFNFLVGSAVFEVVAFAMAGIVGYFFVYRWCRR